MAVNIFLLTESLNDGVLSAKQLAVLTAEDEGLAKVQKGVQEGWPSRLAQEDSLVLRNFGRGEPWTPARVYSTNGARMVTDDANEGDVLHRHLDQVKPRLPESPPESAPSPPRLPQPEAAPGLQ
ncbi:unnamed protein product [Ixodes persulcatus]